MNHMITLNLPENIYQQIRRTAEQTQRPIHDVLVEALTATVPPRGADMADWRIDMAQLAYLNDAALWQAARSTMSESLRSRLESLHMKQQRMSLSVPETEEVNALEALYRDTILVRAQAAILLKHRGYDISNPADFAPLE